MSELWTALLPIYLADVLNPVLFAFLVFAAGTDRPIANSTLMLLGHTVAYFLAGILLAVGIERITERLANPQRIDYFIEIFIGLALLWVALCSRNDTGKRPDEASSSLTLSGAFVLGATVNFIGIPFAVPYFAALNQILKAELSMPVSLAVLGAYNLAYALVFAVVPVLVAVLGKRSQPILQKINDVLERISGFIMPIVLALIGLILTADAGWYLATGEGLF